MRIVVRAHDVRTARDVQAKLAAAGVDAVALAGPHRAAPEGEDITIRAEPGEGADGGVLAVLTAQPYATGPGFSHAAAIAGAIAIDAPPRLLAAQVEAWVRLARVEDERKRRRATVAELGISPPPPVAERSLKALYIGAPSTMFLALERTFAQRGGAVAAAFSSYAGFDHLHDEPFDAVVLNGADEPATAITLCAALRRNSSLYHLPTLLITAPGDAATANAAIERGASAIATANEACGQALGWLFEAVRRERLRRCAEQEIRALGDLVGDSRTGLFQRRPFEAHLARLAADHHESGRPLALAVLRVMTAPGARAPDEAGWTRAFREIGNLAARLMRETDTGVALDAEFLAVALPATSLDGARRMAARIASVAECTAFAAGEKDVGPLVFEQSAVELQPGESGPGALARALRALDVLSLPAEA